MKKIFLNFISILLIFIILVYTLKVLFYFYNTNKSVNQFNELSEKIHISTFKDMNFNNKDLISDEIYNIKDLIKENNDMVGWIEIPNTKIDYPVMNSSNYLYKDFYKNYSISGTPFIDENLKLDKNSDVVTIYGHNMNNGNMFNNLIKYKDEEFFNQNNTINFYTNEKRLTYNIYAVLSLDITNEEDIEIYSVNDITNEEEFNKFTNLIEEKSIFKLDETFKENSNFILLSTCENTNKDKRIVVVGVTN